MNNGLFLTAITAVSVAGGVLVIGVDDLFVRGLIACALPFVGAGLLAMSPMEKR